MGITRDELDALIFDILLSNRWNDELHVSSDELVDALFPMLEQVWDEGFSEAELHIERDEPIRNPYKVVHVYKVEDGHPWKQSQWPSLRDAGQCDLCTAPQHLHMQERS